jgi:hypothetical protein
MPGVGKWRRPYAVSWWRYLLPVPSLVIIFLCLNGGPFAFGIRRDWWLGLLNPLVILLLVVVLFTTWLFGRIGVYVGDAGVMARTEYHRVVVPWQEIAYAEIAEVPRLSTTWQRGPSLGLVLVAPSGQRRPLPVKLAVFHMRGAPPYVPLRQQRMIEVINCINELAAAQRPHAWPPPGGWLFPPR